MEKQYSLKEVRDAMIDKIKVTYPTFTIKENNESELEVKGSKGFGMVIGLSNIVTQINSGGNMEETLNHRIELIKQFQKQMKSMDNMKKWSYVKDKLIFVPMSKGYCENIDNQTKEKTKDMKKKGPSELYYKGFIQDIVLVGAMDFPQYFQYLTKDFIKDWKKTEDEIDEQIGKNMQKFETKYRVSEKDGIFQIVPNGEGILSTFLIKPKKLREIADENGLKGKEVVGTIPFRDVIMFAEHNIENGMKLWTGSNSMIHDNARPYPVSAKPFMIDTEGVVSQFKTDDIPADGILIGVDPKTRHIETLALSRKDSDVTLPGPEEMEEILMKDKNVQKTMSILIGATQGIPSKEFAEKILNFTKDKEMAIMMIEQMIRERYVITKRDNDGVKIYPAPKTIKMMLNKNRGGENKWD